MSLIRSLDPTTTPCGRRRHLECLTDGFGYAAEARDRTPTRRAKRGSGTKTLARASDRNQANVMEPFEPWPVPRPSHAGGQAGGADRPGTPPNLDERGVLERFLSKIPMACSIRPPEQASDRLAARPGRPVIKSILDQDVVAGTAVEDVLARPADQDVVAVAADERVVAVAADEDVVAVAAVDRERRSRRPTGPRRPRRRRRPGR